MEHEAKLPNYKWKIIDEKRAKDMKLSLVDIDDNNTFLMINVNEIPRNVSIHDFIEMINKTGIVCYNKR